MAILRPDRHVQGQRLDRQDAAAQGRQQPPAGNGRGADGGAQQHALDAQGGAYVGQPQIAPAPLRLPEFPYLDALLRAHEQERARRPGRAAYADGARDGHLLDPNRFIVAAAQQRPPAAQGRALFLGARIGAAAGRLFARPRGVRNGHEVLQMAIPFEGLLAEEAVNAVVAQRDEPAREPAGMMRAENVLPVQILLRQLRDDWLQRNPAVMQQALDALGGVRVGDVLQPLVVLDQGRVAAQELQDLPDLEVASATNAVIDAAFFAHAPFPFAQIASLDLTLPERTRDSILNQLRFFAAMEGPAQPFSTRGSVDGFYDGPAVRHVPDSSFMDMKSFVRDIVQRQAPSLFTLILDDGRTSVQAHGEHNPDIGKALFSLSGEFRAALSLAYQRGSEETNYQTLHALFDAIGNWCFDGSINKLNQFLQESALSGDDLSLVPNLDGKHTLEQQAAEYARVFALYQARTFAKETGQEAYDEGGGFTAGFEENYLNGERFRDYLATNESTSLLTATQREQMLRCVTQTLMLFS